MLTYFNKLGIHGYEMNYMFKKNPYIVSLDLHKMVIYKIKLFEEMGLSKKDIGNIFKKFPIIVSKSIISTSRKINYLTKYFHKSILGESYFPLILCYDFDKYIKPRGKFL